MPLTEQQITFFDICSRQDKASVPGPRKGLYCSTRTSEAHYFSGEVSDDGP